jgi:hypothetical protein
MRARSRAALALIAVAGSGAAVATAAGIPGDDAGGSQADPAIQARFSAFRRSPVTADRLPARARLAVEQGPQPELGAEPAQSRKAATLDDDSGLYLVPTARGLCLAADMGTVFCHDADATGRGDLAGVTLLPGDRLRATGAAPDGTSRVLVRLDDGGELAAALGDGAWSLDLPGDAEPVAAVVEGDGWVNTIALASPR